MSRPRPKRYRDAITGRFVSAEYAPERPETTVGERVKAPQPKVEAAPE